MNGPFYFAWVDSTETTFGVTHHREDELIYSFTIDHTEGNIPTLSIDIKNPKIGLLHPGRKIWAWLSWFDGSIYKPLFFGRLVGIPTNILGEVVTLAFIGKPGDYVAQKQALAETLKVRPYYDPIWLDIAHRDDPDSILEGYSALWHVDRTSLALSISDILVGEDGTEIFTADDSFFDSVAITLNQVPLASVKVDATVSWTQQATGTIDLGNKTFSTLTGASLISDWPKPGTSLGAGWSVASSFANDFYDITNEQNVNSSYSDSWTNTEKVHNQGDSMSSSSSGSFSGPTLPGGSITLPYGSSQSVNTQTGIIDPFSDPPVNIPMSISVSSSITIAPYWIVDTNLVLKYDAARVRNERLVFTLHSDIQSILTLPESPTTSDHELITMSSADVGIPVESYHELTDLPFPIIPSPLATPIGNVARRSYFPTDRGLISLEYLIAVARAHLLLRARAVQVSFDCRFERAINLSCRKNAKIYDSRLPGGIAFGKIIGYTIKADGQTGKLIGTVTIGCAIGYGGHVASSDGVPDYVAVGYVDIGYQHYTGATNVMAAGDIAYTIPLDAATDDGLVFPLTKGQAVVTEAIHGSVDSQAAAFLSSTETNGGDVIKANSVWYELVLNPVVNGPFDVQYDITLSKLVVPKMIDLEAASL